jgi:hypothetical protein
MFEWYRSAKLCCVFLDDVRGSPSNIPMEELPQHLSDCRWFKRGWTLEELLAPREVIFYSNDWQAIGKRDEDDIRLVIIAITKIRRRVLEGDVDKVRGFNIA